ncbi:E1-E2 ATPase-domain-containing protein [Jimgerdemannia flammicorona]|uniref:E1-E2 ATPase-domain-containing protein n=1 Tax=Jimgerdemannia flammicorona TaxID=994334 RepID=A0A433Q1B1_9FUNG|nr:E1-E2 ATPase-domain-containing protein [Jimgerdemannia flammicorona]
MPGNRRYNSTTPLLADSDRSDGPFKIDPNELGKLVDPKSQEQLEKLGGVKRICELLRVDPTTGLSPDEQSVEDGESFGDRKRAFGKNSKSYLELVVEAYYDKTLIMLTIAALVSLAVGLWEDYSPRHPADEPRIGWVEGTAILVAVAAVVFTNATNDYQKEIQFKKLNAKKEDRTVKVLRGGKEHQISVFDLNVGDILLLEPGDIIPVDALYLDGHNLACDESSATGESDTMKKREAPGDCFILSGSKVLEGVARVVVIAVGIIPDHNFLLRFLNLTRSKLVLRQDDDGMLSSIEMEAHTRALAHF